jgi:hypothetical protein
VAAALVLSPFLRGSTHAVALAGLGAAGVAWLCVGLALRWSSALTAGIALLGAEQATRLALTSNGVDPWTPVYAIGFLLAAELAWWSIEPRVAAWSDPFLALWRLGAIALVCAGGGFLAAVVVAAAGAPLQGGVGLELVGVIAAAGAVALVAVVSRRALRS